MDENKKVIVIIDGEKVEKEVIEKPDGFDGETGEAVFKKSVACGFDGETGEPVYETIIQDGFDGETGEPIYILEKDAKAASATDAVVEKAGIVPTTIISEVSDGMKAGGSAGKIFAFIGIVAAVIILAAGAVFAAAKSGAFLNKRDKIVLATYNTLKDDTIVGTLIDASEIVQSGDITTEIEGEVSAQGYTGNVKATFASDVSKAKVYAEAEGKIGDDIKQNAQFYMDDSVIQFAVPELSKKVYEYDYTKKNNGFIADAVEESTKGDIDDVNKVIASFSKLLKNNEKYRAELIKNYRKAYKKIKVEGISKETFEIDDKDRKCKGYKVVITGDNVIDFVDAMRKAQKAAYSETIDELSDSLETLGADKIENLDAEYEKLENVAEFMDDVEFEVYLYKGKLAAVVADVEGEKVTVEFQGGDTRTSNIEISVRTSSGKESIKKKSSITDKKEKGKLVAEGKDILNYSYDKSTGKFKLEIEGQNISGVFLVKGGKIKASYEGSYDGVSADLNVTISKGSRISKLSGSKFDLGNASEDDLREEVEAIQDEARELFGSLMNSSYDYDYPAVEEAPAAEEYYDGEEY